MPNLCKRDQRRREVHKKYHVPPEARGVGYWREEENADGTDLTNRRMGQRMALLMIVATGLVLLLWFAPEIGDWASGETHPAPPVEEPHGPKFPKQSKPMFERLQEQQADGEGLETNHTEANEETKE